MYKFAFVGTRGSNEHSKMLSEILLSPSAPFGGIYVPESIPDLGINFLEKHLNSNYEDLAYFIISSFGNDIGNNDFVPSLHTYEKFDDAKNPAPVISIDKLTYVTELYHGPTRAFKDMALQPFGTLLSNIAVAKKQKYLVLAATSGDTGPAALESFKNKKNIKVVCLYPEGGTSKVQKDQMVKMNAENLKVIGIEGNFDDAQTALKNMMKSDTFNFLLNEKGIKLSAANSVNFGRIMFQIVYHFWSYLDLVKNDKINMGDKITSVIPSGNVGNALAAYYAMQMGLPIKKIVLASNANNILTDFVKTGVYDLNNRELIKTSSPAMDILKSSNVERILYHMFGVNRTKELMKFLESENCFVLTKKEKEQIQKVFDADFATDDEVEGQIRYAFLDDNYVMDPHTATAFIVKRKLKLEGVCIISSTAEWTKFTPTMAKTFSCEDDLNVLADKFNQKLTTHISNLEIMPVVHTDSIKIEQIEEEILRFV